MLCTKCGNEIQSPEKFCPKCSAPLEAAPVPNPGSAPNPANPAPGGYVMPAPAKGKAVYGANTIVGIVGAVLAFVSMFLSWLTTDEAKLSFIQIGIRANNADVGKTGIALLVIAFLGIALVVLFQLVKLPKLSALGVLCLLFILVIFLRSKDAIGSTVEIGSAVSWAIGFWVYVTGIIACTVGVFLNKKRI